MKWCDHCRKTDHNDSECWSTRAVPPRQRDPMAGGSLRDLPPFPVSPSLAAYMEALRVAPALTEMGDFHDPESFF